MNQLPVFKESDSVSEDWYRTVKSILEDNDICNYLNMVCLGDKSDNGRSDYYMETEKGGVAILMEDEKSSYKILYAGTKETIELARKTLEDIVKKSLIKV